MKIKLFRKRVSVLRVWIITYILILIIPTVANLIIGSVFMTGLNEKIENYNEAYLAKIATDIDNILVENNRLVARLENDNELLEIADYDGEIDKAGHIRIHEYLFSGDSLNNAKLSNNAKIFLKKSGYLITNESLSKERIAYAAYPLSNEFSYDEWKRLMENSYNHEFVSIGDSLYEIHTIFQGMPYEANVLMQFKKEVFKWNVDSKLFPEGIDIVIYDTSDNRRIYATNDNIDVGSMGFKEISGAFPIRSDESQGMGIYRKSEVANWTYLMVMSNERFYASTRNVLMTEIIVLIASLILSVISLVLLSRYNYRPLQKIINSIGGDVTGSEYDYIEYSLNHMNYKYNDMSRQKLVAQLFSNSVNVDEDSGILKDYGINIENKATAVVMTVEEAGEFIDSDSGQNDIDVLFGALENVFCEIAQGYGFDAYFATCDGVIAILIDVKGEMSVADLLLKVNEVLKSVLGVRCTMCSGGIAESIQGVDKSYEQARQVLELMRFTGESGVGYYSSEVYKKHCPDEKLLNSLCVSALSPEDMTWREIIKEMFSFGIEKPRLRDMRLVLYDISRILLKISKDKNVGNDFEQIRIKSLAGAETLSGFLAEMEALVKEIAVRMDDDGMDNIARIKRFVEEKYNDSNLNNSMIAENVGISANYISKYFKEQTGEGLLNYITKLRVEKAKKLLADTDKTLGDVAVEVGFYNALALIRAYKKVEGITPTQYRAIKDR